MRSQIPASKNSTLTSGFVTDTEEVKYQARTEANAANTLPTILMGTDEVG